MNTIADTATERGLRPQPVSLSTTGYARCYAKKVENMHWKIFTDASSSENAKKVLGWVVGNLSIQINEEKIEPYTKGGFVCSFKAEPSVIAWPAVVLESLKLAQAVGRDWHITGDIENELDIWCNDSSVSGVQQIHIIVKNA